MATDLRKNKFKLCDLCIFGLHFLICVHFYSGLCCTLLYSFTQGGLEINVLKNSRFLVFFFPPPHCKESKSYSGAHSERVLLPSRGPKGVRGARRGALLSRTGSSIWLSQEGGEGKKKRLGRSLFVFWQGGKPRDFVTGKILNTAVHRSRKFDSTWLLDWGSGGSERQKRSRMDLCL